MSNRVLDGWLTLMAIVGSVMVACCVVVFVSCGIAVALDLITLVPYRNLVSIHYLRQDAVEVELLEEDGTLIGIPYLHDPCTFTKSDDCYGDYHAFELRRAMGRVETFIVRIKPDSDGDPNDVEEHRVTFRTGRRAGNLAIIWIEKDGITNGIYDFTPAPR